MKYMGSKNRIAKHILPIMLNYRKPGMPWVEPFVGGGNLIDKVTGPRIGYDGNKHTIEALVAIRDHCHELPKTDRDFTERDYKGLRSKSDGWLAGYAGFSFSYGGKWLGGWSRGTSAAGKPRDYVAESFRNALVQSPKLKGVQLMCAPYDKAHIPQSSLVYCDPPYKGTTGYSVTQFDHEAFFLWCGCLRDAGNIVFVSEYEAPWDFECVWEKEITSSLTKDTGSKRGVEKLFRCLP